MRADFIRHGFKSHTAKSVCNIWRTKYYSVSHSATKPSEHYHQIQHSKPYSRFSHKAKELGLPAPAIVSSALSTSTTSSKFGLVSWYLGMVKSRPIITKSITCAFIYTAADLSSQVILDSHPEKCQARLFLEKVDFLIIIFGIATFFFPLSGCMVAEGCYALSLTFSLFCWL